MGFIAKMNFIDFFQENLVYAIVIVLKAVIKRDCRKQFEDFWE